MISIMARRANCPASPCESIRKAGTQSIAQIFGMLVGKFVVGFKKQPERFGFAVRQEEFL
jgi:hypothetical protein